MWVAEPIPDTENVFFASLLLLIKLLDISSIFSSSNFYTPCDLEHGSQYIILSSIK